MLRATLAVLLCSQVAAPRQLALDQALRLPIAAGEERTLELVVPSPGRLYVHARAPGVRCLLELVAEGAPEPVRASADEGSSTPLAVLRLAEPARVDLRLSLPPGSGACELEVLATLAPATERGRALTDLLALRVEELRERVEAGDREAAAALVAALGAELESEPTATLDPDLSRLAWSVAKAAAALGRTADALALYEVVRTFRERHLPDDHPELLELWQNLAIASFGAGEREKARELFERVLAARERTLAADDERLLQARTNLAVAARQLGDLDRARAMDEAVLEARRARAEGDDPGLVRALFGAADSRAQTGDGTGALSLYEELDSRLASRPADDRQRAEARRLLARHAEEADQRERAEGILRAAVEDLRRLGPRASAARCDASEELANLLLRRGRAAEAHPLYLEVDALFASLPSLPPRRRLIARVNLGACFSDLGRPERARALLEEARAEAARLLSPEDPLRPQILYDLGAALVQLGDLQPALAAFETARELQARHAPPHDEHLVRCEIGMAQVERALGDGSRALARLERVLAGLLAGPPEAREGLEPVRAQLGSVLLGLDRFGEARELLRRAVAEGERTRADDDLHLQVLRHELARAHLALGELDAAHELLERVLALDREHLPRGHPRQLGERVDLAWVRALRGDGAGAAALALELGDLARERARAAALSAAPREAEALASQLSWLSGALASLSARLEPEHARAVEAAGFGLASDLRGLGLVAVRALGESAKDPRLHALREARRSAAAAAMHAAALGHEERLVEAVRERDAAERELLAALGGSAAHRSPADAEALAAALAADRALVLFARTTLRGVDEARPFHEEDAYLAWVLRHGVAPRATRLASAAEVEQAVAAWRAGLGVESTSLPRGQSPGAAPAGAADERESGERLRALVLDPLREQLEGATAWNVVADEALLLVPLDALPEGEGVVGDRARIVLVPAPQLEGSDPRLQAGDALLVLGAPDYDAAREGAQASEELAASVALRGGATGQRFEPLPATREELCAIAALGEELELSVRVLAGDEASKRALAEHAPEARFLHLATHGAFATRGWSEDAAARALERVHGLSPMALCGLALAGANAPAGRFGTVGGILGAEELASWDLSRCELAVLSACETGLGVRAAGQGLASLRKAFHMAGARAVVASSWKVPDEPTRVLMVEFYRRLLREGESASDALWHAKQVLRGRGAPTRDWASWTLSRVGRADS